MVKVILSGQKPCCHLLESVKMSNPCFADDTASSTAEVAKAEKSKSRGFPHVSCLLCSREDVLFLRQVTPKRTNWRRVGKL